MYFDVRAPGNNYTRRKTLIRLLESPFLMIPASGISNTNFLSSDPNKLCYRLKLLIREKQAGNNSDSINEEIIAIVDKLFEYNCISKKQHNFLLAKCSK